MKKQFDFRRMSFYQIWIRSFCDGNGDGIGDLYGVYDKLEYIRDLGVDGIWFSPIFPSPNADYGYDISDYKNIHPDYGTLDLFKKVLDRAHGLGLKVLLDLVINHTSDEHPWFMESCKGKDNPYSDYYIWRDPVFKKKTRCPPNNWFSQFEGMAWEYNEQRGQYYLHIFSRKQPDLNMDNPRVREEVRDIMRFWLDLGVDGFREDVINFISKVPGLPDGIAFLPAINGLPFYKDGPNLHTYLREFRQVALEYGAVQIGEAPFTGVKTALTYIGGKDRVLDMMIQFDVMMADCFLTEYVYHGFRLRKLKRAFSRWQYGLQNASAKKACGSGLLSGCLRFLPGSTNIDATNASVKNASAKKACGSAGPARAHGGRRKQRACAAWNALYLENHDHPRVVSRYGSEKFRRASATMLAAAYLFQRGTPFIYQGQELGMTNIALDSIEKYNDVASRNAYHTFFLHQPVEKRLARIHRSSRDSARTPMQWNGSEGAGFTDGKPWFYINSDYRTVNVEDEEKDPLSVLSFYRKCLKLRRASDTLLWGEYREYFSLDPSLYMYERRGEGESILVVCSFCEKTRKYRFPPEYDILKNDRDFDRRKSRSGYVVRELLLDNYAGTESPDRLRERGGGASGRQGGILQPYEVQVWRFYTFPLCRSAPR